jgi:hypothetical protein
MQTGAWGWQVGLQLLLQLLLVLFWLFQGVLERKGTQSRVHHLDWCLGLAGKVGRCCCCCWWCCCCCSRITTQTGAWGWQVSWQLLLLLLLWLSFKCTSRAEWS